jgi:hypothetical protein
MVKGVPSEGWDSFFIGAKGAPYLWFSVSGFHFSVKDENEVLTSFPLPSWEGVRGRGNCNHPHPNPPPSRGRE